MTHGHLHGNLLAAIAALDGWNLEDLEALAAAAEQVALRRGDVLVRQGDPSDALYFVLSGRFAVHVDGVVEPIAEIAHGQPVGEIGFFGGLPRTATVVALRDSRVLALTRERFRQLSESSTRVHDAVIHSLARRLAGAVRQATGDRSPVRTIAVMPAGGSEIPRPFAEAIRDVFGTSSRAVFLTAEEIAARLPGFPLADPVMSRLLDSLEIESDFVFYLADPTLTEWTKKCIRQADALLLVATAEAPVDLNPSEVFAFSTHPPSARRLVVVHGARTGVVSGTSAWLESRDVLMHHHVALHDRDDVRRLYRFASGRAVGFVAGGGGALGSAHLGVYKAFCDAGADFDVLGGTSTGAAMAAGLAYGVGPERIDEGTHNIFVKSRAFRRPTWPRYALIDHKVFDRALHAEYGDVLIEDLWIPFFAVSSNLSERHPMVHRRGPVWQAVRASGSIPGVLPPFFTRDGAMLVDGGLMDNIPLAQMNALKAGPNVIVALGAETRMMFDVDYDAIPGCTALLAALLNPVARRRLPQIPNILQVITLSMVANRRQLLPLTDRDVLIRPEIPVDYRFTSWERHTELFLKSWREVGSWIEMRLTEGDRALSSVLKGG